jgi:predicted nucleotidyltransferase
MISKEIELIHKFRSLVEERLHVHSMIVFGSRARGDARENSDMDVLVVIEEEETFDLRMFVFDCAWEAGLESGIVICPLLFSRHRWENGPERASILAMNIAKEGIEV